MEFINHGALIGRKDSDLAGGYLPYREVLADGNWNKPEFLPTNEKQWGRGGDKMNCVTQSNHNTKEIQLNQQIADGSMPVGHLVYLNDEGFIDENGKVNFSDKFNSILNGTTRVGNWLWKVAEDARVHSGLVPQSKLLENIEESWDDYYNKDQITPELLALGKKTLEYFKIDYEWINDTSIKNLKKQLKHAPLQVVIPGHAVVQLLNEGELMTYLDSYDPYIKKTQQSRIVDFLKILIYPINNKTMSNVKVIKDKNSKAVGFWLPATSPEGLSSLAKNLGVDLIKKDNGEIDWDKNIQGELTLK